MSECAQCYRLFVPRSNGGAPQKYCSKICSNLRPRPQGPCLKCGKTNRNSSGNCKDCAAAHNLARSVNLIPCVKCGSLDRSKSGACRLCRRASGLLRRERAKPCVKCGSVSRRHNGDCSICYKTMMAGLAINKVPCRICGSPDREPCGACRACKGKDDKSSIAGKEWRARNVEKVKEKNYQNRSEYMSTPEGNITLLLYAAKARAKRKCLPFSVSITDLLPLPTHCPVLGNELEYGRKDKKKPGSWSPSIDRITPSLGYIPGNVWVISYRANTIKNDATPEELNLVATAVSRRLGNVK